MWWPRVVSCRVVSCRVVARSHTVLVCIIIIIIIIIIIHMCEKAEVFLFFAELEDSDIMACV
jgi:uncharacterized integral membrane protein